MTPHILLAEDNKADVFLLREALQAHSVKAILHVVEDGEAAISFVTRADADDSAPCPSLFLIDLNLPKRSGREVLSHIRHSTKCAQIPVLIVTSSDSKTDRAEAAELGANGYFLKPSAYLSYIKIGQVIKDMLAPPEK